MILVAINVFEHVDAPMRAFHSTGPMGSTFPHISEANCR